MAIIQCPDDKPQRTSRCVVCRVEKPLNEMGAGMCDEQNQQAFACDQHFWNKSEYVLGWTDFAAAQRHSRAHWEFARPRLGASDE